MIDLHSHILPGVDDGVATLEEARELARAAVVDGATAIAATPHVREDYPTSADQMEEGVAALRRDFGEQGIELEVLTGGEVALDLVSTLGSDELRRFSLGGSERYLLVEFPYVGWPLGLETALHHLGAAGLTAVLAHPERNKTVQADPERLEPAISAGALVQLTASSLDGRGGTSARGAARALLGLGFVHVLASDAHSPLVREAGLAAAAAAIGDPALARHLVQEVPAAIVAGAPIPALPRMRRRPRLASFFGSR
jgi:protein-tyrosine phosphatase